jgi:LPXTG-motif cell wall-anchored protein
VSLSSDGSTVAIGAPYNEGNGSSAGHVRIYQLDGNAWVKMGSDIDGEAAEDYSGEAVSLSSDGTRVAIGAPYNGGSATEAGHVRVFDLDGGAWVQVGSDIDGEAEADNLSFSVALSSDGSRLAISAEYNVGAGYDEAGHVRVFALTADNWTQIGSDFDGEATSESLGTSVSLNSDGSHLAIGAPGIGAGRVEVHSYPVPEDENENGTPSEELADTGGVDASGIAFGGAIALVAGAGGYLLRRRGARA